MQSQETIPASESSPERRPIIYVVDDEAMIGEMVEFVLKAAGYETKFFLDPEQAYEALGEADLKPDLLLTDFRMGSINGMELIERCRQIQPSLRAILISGNVGPEIAQYYSAKPDCFLSKPFLPKALVQTVESVLAS
ncbi:MAG: response regulator [Verrucomicrobiota bacterium]